MTSISRRGLLGMSAAGLTSGLLGAKAATAAPTRGGADLVETSAGWVRGRRADGVSAFLGIPYGSADRFQAPTAPAPWREVRDATRYGHIAPQPLPGARLDYTRLIGWLDHPGGQDEDCLVLNVWTPSPGGARRPVLVSYHGGGFSTGSGNHRGFDGDPLARFGDVVVVTVNHRLGLLGFLHLADLGAPREWATAGVNGMLDAVAALRWVNENIANFGGDPGEVMVFGQSGGGAKTSTLLAMPSARDLLHRAAVQNGPTLTLATRETGSRNVRRLLGRLGLSTRRITELRDVPVEMMVSAGDAVGSLAMPHTVGITLRAVWWRPGDPEPTFLPGPVYAGAWAIDDLGYKVGWGETSEGDWSALVWDADGQLVREFGPVGDGDTALYLRDIDDGIALASRDQPNGAEDLALVDVVTGSITPLPNTDGLEGPLFEDGWIVATTERLLPPIVWRDGTRYELPAVPDTTRRRVADLKVFGSTAVLAGSSRPEPYDSAPIPTVWQCG